MSIATLTGQNGILTQANDAKTKNKIESDIEAIRLAMTVDDMAWYSGNYPEEEDLFLEELRKTDSNAMIDWNYSEYEILIHYNDDDYILDYITGEVYSKQKQEEEQSAKAMKIKVNTGNDGKVLLPISIDEKQCNINWGDGNVTDSATKENVLLQEKIASLNSIKLASAMIEPRYTHQYTEEYKNKEIIIVITGKVQEIKATIDDENGEECLDTKNKIIEIVQWGDLGITSIELNGCSNLRYVPAIPNSVTDLRYGFANCTSLTKAPTIPGSVEKMIYSFKNCTSLTQPPEILNGVRDMSMAFTGCTSLTTTPFIPDSVIDMDDAFSGCTNLTKITNIPNNVQQMSGTFENCKILTTVPSIPEGVTEMDYTFRSCEKLTGTLEINANPTSYIECFLGAACEDILIITGKSNIIDELIETNASGSHIIKGN